MDLGYYSLCRWDGQNPCGFLSEEGASLRNNNNNLKKDFKSGTGQYRLNKDAALLSFSLISQTHL